MTWFKTQLAAMRNLSARVFIASLLQCLGALWLVVESTNFFFPELGSSARNWRWAFLTVAAIFGLLKAWPRLSVKSRVSDTDALVEIRVCDVLSLSGALVVGSNRTFDTSIEDGTISEASVQGQFTRQFADSVDALDRQIDDSLKNTPFEPRTKDKPYGKQQEYAIGTVASVTCSSKRAYLVAIASLNSHRVASTNLEDVLDALPLLWEFVRNRGGLEPLCCPILGSGFSRVKTSRQELIREIVKSFVAASRTGKFCEHLTIAILPEDFRRGHINLDALGRFLEHECTYHGFRTSVSAAPQGTPLNPLEAAQEAKLRAVLDRSEQSPALLVINDGVAEARNISINIDGTPILEHSIVMHNQQEVQLLGPGGSTRYILVLTIGTPSLIHVEIGWDDEAVSGQSWRSELSVF